MIKTIDLNDRQIEYILERKKVKNINLRIKSDLSIHVSASKWVSEKFIEDFLISRSDFILNALQKYSELQKNSPEPREYITGETLNILGKSLTLNVIKGSKNSVTNDENYIYLTVKDTDDIELKKKAVNKWEKERCSEIVIDICKKTYPLFTQYVKEFPQIKFRNMVSQWGNCHPHQNILTFNTALIEVPLPCIEYVVMHEFTHFIHADHSHNFYNSLEAFMPDWKERRNLLKNYRLQK